MAADPRLVQYSTNGTVVAADLRLVLVRTDTEIEVVIVGIVIVGIVIVGIVIVGIVLASTSGSYLLILIL